MGKPTVDIFITILYTILIAKLIFWVLRVGVHIGGDRTNLGEAGEASEAGEAGKASEAGEAGGAGEAGEAGEASEAGDKRLKNQWFFEVGGASIRFAI